MGLQPLRKSSQRFSSSWRLKLCHDPRRTPPASPRPRTRSRRSPTRSRGCSHPALRPRCPRGPISHAPRHHSRPCHPTTPPFPPLLRLRGRHLSRISRRPSARRRHFRQGAFAHRRRHRGRLTRLLFLALSVELPSFLFGLLRSGDFARGPTSSVSVFSQSLSSSAVPTQEPT